MGALWAPKSEGVWLIVRAISFRDFQPMWSWSTNVTDRRTDRRTDGQTTCNLNTALCTIVHRAVKTAILGVFDHRTFATFRIRPEVIISFLLPRSTWPWMTLSWLIDWLNVNGRPSYNEIRSLMIHNVLVTSLPGFSFEYLQWSTPWGQGFDLKPILSRFLIMVPFLIAPSNALH